MDPQNTQFKKGEHRSLNTEFKKGFTPWNKGKKMSVAFIEANRIGHLNKNTGKDNPTWKGDSVGYHALHDWVERKMGKAVCCDNCGSYKNIQWANRSGEYKRELSDWIQLCGKCHYIYDGKHLMNIVSRVFKTSTGHGGRILYE